MNQTSVVYLVVNKYLDRRHIAGLDPPPPLSPLGERLSHPVFDMWGTEQEN